MGSEELVHTAVVLSNAGVSHCPAVPGEKRPIGSWKTLQENIIDPNDVKNLYVGAENMGIITGRVSGGDPRRSLEVIDFDDMDVLRKMPEEVRAFMKARTYMEKSPHGVHTIYRYDCDETPAGNQKLACPPDPKAKAWIETRGEGGFLIVAPSPGYKRHFGDLSNPGVLTRQERDWLIAECKKLDQSATAPAPKPRPKPTTTVIVPAASGFSPGPVEDTPQEAYNKNSERNGIAPLLERHGWTLDHVDPTNEHWTRPEKDSGTSATWNGKVFYVFTSTCSLDPGAGYSAFYVYAHYEYGGDMSTAALALEAQGVGKLAKPSEMMTSSWTISPTTPSAETDSGSEPEVPTFNGPSWAEVMEAIKGSPLEVYIEEVSNSIGNLSKEIPLMHSILLAGLVMANNGSNGVDGSLSVLSTVDLQPIRMNVYGMSLCTSGAGKGLTSGCLRAMMTLLGIPSLKGNSEAAIAKQSEDGKMFGLYHAPEIVKLMSTRNVVAVGICNCLLEAFNSGEIHWVTQPGGKTKSIIQNPAAPSFMVEGQPDVFERVCHDSNMSSGFLARFLVAMSKKPKRTRVCRTGAADHVRIMAAYQPYKSFPGRIIRPVYQMELSEDVYAGLDDAVCSAIDKLSGEYIPKIASMLNPAVSATGRIGLDEMRRADVIAKWFATRSVSMFGLVHEDLKEVKRARMERRIFEQSGIDNVSLYKFLHVSVADFEKDYAPSVLARGDVERRQEGRFIRWYPKSALKPFVPSMVTPVPDPAATVPPVIIPVPPAANPLTNPTPSHVEETSDKREEGDFGQGDF